MLYRNLDEEKRSEVDTELEKPLPGQARQAPSPQERQKIHDEWAGFMKQVG